MATKPKSAKPASESTEVATTTPGSSNVPAYLQGSNKGSGLSGLDMSDFVVPRIKLLQAVSEEVKNFENAVAGHFWMTVIDEPLGDTLEFIVCTNKKRYLLMAPMEDSQGVLARADDAKTWVPSEGSWQIKMKGIKNPITWTISDPSVAASGLADFGSSNPDDPDSPPAATLFYDYLIYLPGRPDISPAMMSLARSAAKKAKDLNGKLQFGNAPMQAQKILATVIEDSSNNQDFYNYAFRKNGWAEEEDFNKAVELHQRFGGEFRAADEDKMAAEEKGVRADSSEF